ncbi:MAG: DegT/DnrJ/EryC1/StrS family aminotransferase, partial [Bacteroidota bacterium]
EIAKKHKLIVIEDLAHSLLSSYKGKKLGTYGDFALLCFTKKIINYEGGAVGTNNTDIYDKLRSLQLEYHTKGQFNLKNVLEKYGRIYGSYWESKFPFWIVWASYIQYLIYMAFFHKKVFDEKQWFKVDHSKFKPSKISALITAGQLDILKIRNSEMNYLKFKEKFKNKIQVYDKELKEDDTPPAYYSGTIIQDHYLLKKACLPTWRNFNPVGKYPRADYLYTNYKIFSKIIMYL